jgi:hypothetical protein
MVVVVNDVEGNVFRAVKMGVILRAGPLGIAKTGRTTLFSNYDHLHHRERTMATRIGWFSSAATGIIEAAGGTAGDATDQYKDLPFPTFLTRPLPHSTTLFNRFDHELWS